MTSARLSVGPLLVEVAGRLRAMQHEMDGPHHHRGEFPMSLRGPVSRADHNYLSGYTLLHLAFAHERPGLPPAARAVVAEILGRASDLPARYRSPALTCNWYSGKGTGLRAPPDYPWPDGRVLALRDDYDDTAISAILTCVGPFRAGEPFLPDLFEQAQYAPERHQLVPKSIRRLGLTGCGRDVYQSWVLPDGGGEEPPPPGIVLLPPANSVELTTAANVVTAVHLLGGAPDAPGQVASRAFVNRLARLGIDKLLEGDASYLDFASSYYPRVPFAPLGFLARDHVATGRTLLEPETLALLARAVLEVSEDAAWRSSGLANRAFWLHCAAWCLAAEVISPDEIRPKLERVWRRVGPDLAPALAIPDMVFFHGAHLGDYGGVPYVLSMVLETLSLLHEFDLGGPP